MEDMETRVWQRVAGKPQMDLLALARLSREQAAALGRLGSASSGQRRNVLRGLSAQAVFAARVVEGAAILQGERPPAETGTYAEAASRRALALACRRSRTLWEAYSARAGSGEYGQVFRYLADREAQAGAELLAILGGM